MSKNLLVKNRLNRLLKWYNETQLAAFSISIDNKKERDSLFLKADAIYDEILSIKYLLNNK